MEITNKWQMIEYLEKGLSRDIYKRFGVFSVDFYPFEGKHTREYERLVSFIDDDSIEDDEEIEVTKEDLADAMRANISTVFHGIRFYFYKYEDLKKFCEIVENS